MKFKFKKITDLLRIAQETEKPIVLVKDHGVYLMVSGCPESVVYATGRNPDKDPNYYVGGDDYVEQAMDLDTVKNILEVHTDKIDKMWVEVNMTDKDYTVDILA